MSLLPWRNAHLVRTRSPSARRIGDVVTRRLPERIWRPRARAHSERADALVADHLHRRAEGLSHPVHDFMFTYYRFRPAQLRRWHPGYGTHLAGGAHDYRALRGYQATSDGGARVGQAYLTSQHGLLRGLANLLRATHRRIANFSCFGLHEWAMVYRTDEVRHGGYPLRLGVAGTDEVVRDHRIACSHFDAYRFFTPAARDRNVLRPRPADREAFEQPGCLHAGMDLYKHAYRLSPLIDAGLVLDCFEHARAIRELDMRAAPYDLRSLGYQPVPIETPAGKAQYVRAQRDFAEQGAILRERLLEVCAELLAAADQLNSKAIS